MKKYTVKYTTQFKKDYKAAIKRGLKMELLETVIATLASGEALAEKHRDRSLTGSWIGFRECHILPDWRLIYRVENDVLVLTMTRTGSHSDLFASKYFRGVSFSARLPCLFLCVSCCNCSRKGKRQHETNICLFGTNVVRLCLGDKSGIGSASHAIAWSGRMSTDGSVPAAATKVFCFPDNPSSHSVTCFVSIWGILWRRN